MEECVVTAPLHSYNLHSKNSHATVVTKYLAKATTWCKNTWVTLTTFLGRLDCISGTKNCYQIGFLENSLKSFSLVTSTLAGLLFQKTCLATFPAFLATAMQLRNSPEADV